MALEMVIKKCVMIPALVVGLSVSACSPNPATQIGSSTINRTDNGAPKRSTPVIPGRPARMFIWAGFDENTCKPIAAEVALANAPAKGSVEFKPNQSTLIKHSNSGKCIGKRMRGTGIYYTARFGQAGADQFSVTATTPSGQTATRKFNIKISE